MFTYDLLSKNVNTLEIENLGVVNLYNTDNLTELSKDIDNSTNGFGISLVFNSNNIDSTRAGLYFNNGTKSSNMRMIYLGSDNLPREIILILLDLLPLLKYSPALVLSMLIMVPNLVI